jgi:hypothetical protein
MSESETRGDDDEEDAGDDTSRGKLHVFACVFASSSENSLERIVIKGSHLSTETNVVTLFNFSSFLSAFFEHLNWNWLNKCNKLKS